MNIVVAVVALLSSYGLRLQGVDALFCTYCISETIKVAPKESRATTTNNGSTYKVYLHPLPSDTRRTTCDLVPSMTICRFSSTCIFTGYVH